MVNTIVPSNFVYLMMEQVLDRHGTKIENISQYCLSLLLNGCSWGSVAVIIKTG